ncbi:hypothetical protein ACSBR1_024801 [Camellia fascicularis]
MHILGSKWLGLEEALKPYSPLQQKEFPFASSVVWMSSTNPMVWFFSDTSETYELRNISQPNFKPESTGRLLKYDVRTKQVTVLLAGLALAIGPAVGANSTFVLVSEYQLRRLQKFYLTGPTANTSEVFLNLPVNPNKTKRTASGDFWVSIGVRSQAPSGAHNPNGAEVQCGWDSDGTGTNEET